MALSATQKEKLKKGGCLTLYCRNKKAESNGGHYCHKCCRKKWAAKNPLKYIYFALKYNAKRRGKGFELSYIEFKDIAISSGYIYKRGITRDALTIDRIDNDKGYSIDNIRIISMSENSIKGASKINLPF